MPTVDLPEESRHGGRPDSSSLDLASPAVRADRDFLRRQKRNSRLAKGFFGEETGNRTDLGLPIGFFSWADPFGLSGLGLLDLNSSFFFSV